MGKLVKVTTTLPEIEHLKGRTYKVKVDRHHRPAQIHRATVPSVYDGEVDDNNASEFKMMYVRGSLHERAMTLFGYTTPEGCDKTFNEVLEVLVGFAEENPSVLNSYVKRVEAVAA